MVGRMNIIQFITVDWIIIIFHEVSYIKYKKDKMTSLTIILNQIFVKKQKSIKKKHHKNVKFIAWTLLIEQSSKKIEIELTGQLFQ